ncbi:hypothetical protein A0H76_2345 [Hepatospora eriocheir]|uniref:Uncharacterized protein n=1 Tax=Hepatospora eriocheir TaxID=1081669 RepID=A0A1X0QFT6_9MICR|nr:hypothetical protein A0H76_2345 [Hepatospora eriocheir]
MKIFRLKSLIGLLKVNCSIENTHIYQEIESETIYRNTPEVFQEILTSDTEKEYQRSKKYIKKLNIAYKTTQYFLREVIDVLMKENKTSYKLMNELKNESIDKLISKIKVIKSLINIILKIVDYHNENLNNLDEQSENVYYGNPVFI